MKIISFSVRLVILARIALSAANVKSRVEACNSLHYNSICDPDSLLSFHDANAIQEEIYSFHGAVLFSCNKYYKRVPIPLSVYIESHNTSKVANISKHVFDEWSAAKEVTVCGESGILLYMAAQDREFGIVRGAALNATFPDSLLRPLINQTRFFVTLNGNYAQALEFAILQLKHSQDQDTSTEEKEPGVFSWIMLFLICWFLLAIVHAKPDSEPHRGSGGLQHLKQRLKHLDESHIQAVQCRYSATSCPVCLLSFCKVAPLYQNTAATETSPLVTIDHSRSKIGSDLHPLRIFDCGHVIDQCCWSIRRDADQLASCPICGCNGSRSWCNFSTGQGVNYDLYFEERQYRLQRLKVLFPNLIRSEWITEWSSPQYRGSLYRDFCILASLETDTHNDQEQEEHNSPSPITTDSTASTGESLVGHADDGGTRDSSVSGNNVADGKGGPLDAELVGARSGIQRCVSTKFRPALVSLIRD